MLIYVEPKFRRGEQVVCIDDDFAELLSRKWSIPGDQFNFPKEGKTYEIREMIYVPARMDWGVLLVEVKNGVLVETGCELNFSQTRFSKQNELGLTREEDVAIQQSIERILTPELV